MPWSCPNCKTPTSRDGWEDRCLKCDQPLKYKPPTYKERVSTSRKSKLAMAAWVAAYQAGANGLDMWRAFAEWSEVDE